MKRIKDWFIYIYEVLLYLWLSLTFYNLFLFLLKKCSAMLWKQVKHWKWRCNVTCKETWFRCSAQWKWDFYAILVQHFKKITNFFWISQIENQRQKKSALVRFSLWKWRKNPEKKEVTNHNIQVDPEALPLVHSIHTTFNRNFYQGFFHQANQSVI